MLKRLFFILIFFPILVGAQTTEVFTYQQVVELALNNNFDIQIAKNNSTVSVIQNSIGNAGFLPRVDLISRGELSNNSIHQEFSSAAPNVDKNDVASNSTTTGVYLIWTLFDGIKMFATKEKLNLLEQQGQLSLKLQIENTLEEVTLSYYQIVKQTQLIKGLEVAMSVSEERIKIAEKKAALGSGSNVELLQAKLDRNAQKSSLIVQRDLLNEYKGQLLVLTKTNPFTSFAVDTIFSFEEPKSVEEIKQSIEKANTSILLAHKEVSVSKQVIKEIRSQALPKLDFVGNYLFTRSQNAAGFTLLNRNLGYNYGLLLTWKLFSGFNTYNQMKVAKLQLENSSIEVESTRFTILSGASIYYTRWLNAKQMLDLEEENIKLAEQSLKIMTERLRLGLGNYLEIKDSQRIYEDATTRLVNARYYLKESETVLKKLMGELVK